MSKFTFFPYRALPDKITLSFGTQDPNLKDAPPERIPAYKAAASEVPFEVVAKLPDSLLKEVLAPQEREAPPVEMRLRLQGIEARQRQATRLTFKDGSYQRSVVLRKRDWCGTVHAQAFLIRTTAGIGLPNGYARDRGAVLASSEVVEILFDEPVAPPAGGLLNIQWVDFTQSELPWLKQQASHMFALDVNADPPALFLNRGLPGAYTTLTAGGHTGPRARMRDLSFNLIVHQVWTSLLGTALTALASVVREAGEEKPDLNELATWQQAVIRDWAHELFPECNKGDEALDAVYEALRPSDWTRELLLQRVPQALQERFKTGHKLSQAAAEVLES